MKETDKKYRDESIRLKNWDYSSPGAYFITICTKKREEYLGHIFDGKMILSHSGKIAHTIWHEIPKHFQNATLDAFVVMPDHIHGIIIINVICRDVASVCRDVACNVPTNNVNTNANANPMSIISPKPGSLSTIIRSYKSAVTRICNNKSLPFAWQARFYDHIIRNNISMERIRQYIQNNPVRWKAE